MSLIQVSSSQERLQNVSQGKQTFQRGHSFSNYFNNLLNIPKDSEIAVHSAQFNVQNRTTFDFNGLPQYGHIYNLRMLYGSDQDDYSEVVPPLFPTHFPLINYIPSKKYSEIDAVADDIVKLLNLTSTPALQGAFTNQITMTALNKKQVDLKVTLNAGNTVGEAIDAATFSGEAGLTLDGYTVEKTSAGEVGFEKTFTTKSNGIHNIGEILFDNLQAPSDKFGGLPYPNRRNAHNMVLGVKRFGAYDTVDPMGNFQDSVQPQAQAFRSMRFLDRKKVIGEYMFIVTTKGETLIPVIHIVKYEVNIIGNPVPVMIATGDIATMNEQYNVPYAPLLDPESDEYAAITGLTSLQVIAPYGTPSPSLKIKFLGNKVSFTIKGIGAGAVDVPIQSSQIRGGTLADVVAPLQDIVFPLQPYGMLTGTGDRMDVDFTPIKENGQKAIAYYGNTYNDYTKYVVYNNLIPSSVYNLNADVRSPVNYFALVGNEYVINPENANIKYDTIDGDYLTNGADDRSGTLVIGIGQNVSTDMIVQSPNLGVVNPNVKEMLGTLNSAIVFTQDEEEGKLKGNFISNLADTVSPFLKGIYVRLKNLPNRSTFGSLNTADTDKLISVITKYDYTENQEGKQYPVYNFSENEKLYVALNNPAEIQVNKLDFELVDKFGRPVTDVDETTLVLHLRPRRV
tara:strand:- start:2132 stop:4168 length:2037 start_codon:yes stop_codon:yes gene_type:complete